MEDGIVNQTFQSNDNRLFADNPHVILNRFEHVGEGGSMDLYRGEVKTPKQSGVLFTGTSPFPLNRKTDSTTENITFPANFVFWQ